MAIYHFSIGKISRAKGRSSVQKMSYICCTMAKDERTNRTFRYLTKQNELVHTETSLPKNAPDSWKNPTVLWNAVEQSEKKSNAKIAYDMDGAFPNELTYEQMIEVCRKQAEYMTDKGFCVTWAIHDKHDGNPHVHILATTRPLDKNGNFTTKEKKVPVLDADGNKVPLIDEKTGEQKIRKRKRVAENGKEYYSEEKLWQTKKVTYNPLDGRELYKEIRQSWADICNEYLPEEEKISPLSNKERGIEQTPSVHIGAVAKKIEERNEKSWKMENFLQREVIRAREVITKLIEEKLEQAKQLQQVIQTKMQSLKEYVNSYLQKKIEKEQEQEQNKYPPMYKVVLEQERKRKKFAEEHYQYYDQYKDAYIKLTDTIDRNDSKMQSLISENTKLKLKLENLRRKKADRDAVREPLAEFKKHFEIYNQKIEEVREEEKKLFKNKKKIDRLYEEADKERDEFNKAGDVIYHQIGKVGVSMPAEKYAAEAEKLLNEVDPSNQITSIKDSISKNENRIKQLDTVQINKKDELDKFTTAIEYISTYMDKTTTLEDDYKAMAYYLYDYIEGDERNGYTVHLKPLESIDSQWAYLTLAKVELRQNKHLNELLDGLEEYCLLDYQDREYLYEQCPNANKLKVVYEYGSYSVIGKDYDGYTIEIKDPKDRDVKTFSFEEDAIEYKNLIKEKINSYKEEKGIEIEEESYDYDFEMHM